MNVERLAVERAAFCALMLCIPGVGRVGVQKFMNHLNSKKVGYGECWSSAEAFVRLLRRGFSLSDAGFRIDLDEAKKIRDRWTLSDFVEMLEEKQISLIDDTSQSYPFLLAQAPDHPPVLYARGNSDCLRPTHIAVVGSRRPTLYGQLAVETVLAGLPLETCIVSGFMAGIDYKAHQTAVALGLRSVGVLGFGFDAFYPAHLRQAAAEFVEQGNLLITEHPPHVTPLPGFFAARNRIVAGIAVGTLVVEAREKSGSLITAQCALDYDRVVAAIPGPIDSLHSVGTNTLLKQGAVLVQNGPDLWQACVPG